MAFDLKNVQAILRSFSKEREWDRFHTPKNLAMALAGEVGELVEIFQWLTPEESVRVMESPPTAEGVRDELADVLLYCVRLADVLGVDMEAAITEKMAKNAAKYPADLARGTSTKYTHLKGP